MNLLLTNDDGVFAPGITVLAEYLSKKHSVYVLAPDTNRSAVSHCITMYNPLSIKSVRENVWSCSGMPSDCVVAGIHSNLIEKKIDAVVSGINTGANLGTDIIYSGTCAAARQSILYGIPAVAFSLDPLDWEKANKEGFKFTALADFAAKNIERLVELASLKPPRTFVNVNAASLDSYKGVQFASELCIRNYNDRLELQSDNDGQKAVFKSGGTQTEENPKSDNTICRNGYISISLVYADPVCAQSVDGMTFSL